MKRNLSNNLQHDAARSAHTLLLPWTSGEIFDYYIINYFRALLYHSLYYIPNIVDILYKSTNRSSSYAVQVGSNNPFRCVRFLCARWFCSDIFQTFRF